MFALGKLIRLRFEKSGLMPPGQLETLRFVAEHECSAMHDVARLHSITAPSATVHVDELVRAGYLRRVADTSDRRAVRLAITASGKRMLRSTLRKRERIIKNVFAPLTEADRKMLNRIVGKIIAAHK